MERYIAFIISSLIGGFFFISLLISVLAIKKPAIKEPNMRRTIIKTKAQIGIDIIICYALESYSPVSVLMMILVLFLTNIGTLNLYPVSKIASFVALLTVSPETALSSDSVIVKVTLAGSSTPNISFS